MFRLGTGIVSYHINNYLWAGWGRESGKSGKQVTASRVGFAVALLALVFVCLVQGQVGIEGFLGNSLTPRHGCLLGARLKQRGLSSIVAVNALGCWG